MITSEIISTKDQMLLNSRRNPRKGEPEMPVVIPSILPTTRELDTNKPDHVYRLTFSISFFFWVQISSFYYFL